MLSNCVKRQLDLFFCFPKTINKNSCWKCSNRNSPNLICSHDIFRSFRVVFIRIFITFEKWIALVRTKNHNTMDKLRSCWDCTRIDFISKSKKVCHAFSIGECNLTLANRQEWKQRFRKPFRDDDFESKSKSTSHFTALFHTHHFHCYVHKENETKIKSSNEENCNEFNGLEIWHLKFMKIFFFLFLSQTEIGASPFLLKTVDYLIVVFRWTHNTVMMLIVTKISFI